MQEERGEPRYSHAERYTDLGLTIAAFRKKKRMSQEKLGFLTGLDRSTISRIETNQGGKGVELETLFNISDALGIEPSELLKIRYEYPPCP